MEIIRLNRTSRILSGHLWVFSNELATSPKKYEPGSILELRDRKDNFLGIGYINPNSLIAIRILTFEKETVDPDFFRRRISDAFEYRKRFIKDSGSFRLVFSEGDLLPGLVVDKYEDCLSIQLLTLGMERWQDVIISILDEMFSPSLIVLRNDSPARILEGLKMEKKIVKGATDKLPIIREGSFLFEVSPLSGQKTGFFLDQKENRTAFSKMINSGKGLDLFCYTGAWSIHMSGRGASVIGVDESEYAIENAETNAGLNKLSGNCIFKKADVFEFLKDEISKGNKYDFIVLDPPAFVKSKTKLKEALRGYRELNSKAMRLLRKGGILATSSCSYHVSRDVFLDMLRASARDSGRRLRLLEFRSQARDHPILLSMPETEYLKCAFLDVN